MTDFTQKWRPGNTVYLRCGETLLLKEGAIKIENNKLIIDGPKQLWRWDLNGRSLVHYESPYDIVKIEAARIAGSRERMREIMWGSDRENEA